MRRTKRTKKVGGRYRKAKRGGGWGTVLGSLASSIVPSILNKIIPDKMPKEASGMRRRKRTRKGGMQPMFAGKQRLLGANGAGRYRGQGYLTAGPSR